MKNKIYVIKGDVIQMKNTIKINIMILIVIFSFLVPKNSIAEESDNLAITFKDKNL